MKINSKLQLKYDSSKSCETVFKSLEVDNKNFIDSKQKTNEIIYNISSESLGSFLATVDDLISSKIVVEKIIISTKDN